MMRHLNYHHLLYFHTVAEEGSVAAAAALLHITPQTISGQIKLLEAAVGQPLFIKSGRGLKISDTGRAVKTYTDEIFTLGLNLSEHIRNNQLGASAELHVGIADSIPKLVACQLTMPVFDQSERVKLVCTEGKLENLLAELAIHKLDLIISDHSIPSGYSVRAYNHPLGKTPVAFFSPRKWASRLTKGFPFSLDSVPVLMPSHNSPLRRRLDSWFEEAGLEPSVIAEFDDSAMMKTFGEAELGVFPSPEIIDNDISQHYRVKNIGRIEGVYEEYFIISPQRRLKQDAVKALVENGRSILGA